MPQCPPEFASCSYRKSPRTAIYFLARRNSRQLTDDERCAQADMTTLLENWMLSGSRHYALSRIITRGRKSLAYLSRHRALEACYVVQADAFITISMPMVAERPRIITPLAYMPDKRRWRSSRSFTAITRGRPATARPYADRVAVRATTRGRAARRSSPRRILMGARCRIYKSCRCDMASRRRRAIFAAQALLAKITP